MATTKIGVKIGVEGWDAYSNQMKVLINQTKELNSASELITKTFNSEGKSIKSVHDLKANYEKQIVTLNKEIETQTKLLKEVSDEYEKGGEGSQKLEAKIAELKGSIYNTTLQIDDFADRIRALPSDFEIVGEKIQNVGQDILNIGSALTDNISKPVANFMKQTIDEAINWESAFTGVKKTNEEIVDSNGNVIYSYDQMEKELQEIGLHTASDFKTIAATAEVAGQLGVVSNEVPKFTEAMIEMGDSTNLSAEEAASSIATILNITNKGLPISAEQARKLGSAIVYLGNNYNTSESDIAHMGTRLAAGATLAGLTASETLGLATAMSSVGINAEAGGTAMSQTLAKIQKEFASFNSGAESNLPRIAEIAHMSADEFATAWSERPVEAVISFIKGLGDLDAASGETVLVLDELDMKGIRQANMLESLALASDILESSVRDSNKAFEEGTALSEEAALRYQDVASQIQQLKNDFSLLMIDIGDMLLPTLRDLIDFGKQLVDWARNLSPETKQLIVDCMKFAVVIGPVVKGIGSLTIGAGQLVSSIGVLTGKAGIGSALTGLSGLAKGAEVAAGTVGGGGIMSLLKPIGLVSVAIGAVSFVKWAIKNEEALKKFGDDWNKTTNALQTDWDTLSVAADSTFNDINESILNNTTSAKDNATTNFSELKTNAERYAEDTRRAVIFDFNDIKNQTNSSMQTTKSNIVRESSNIKTSVSNDFAKVESEMIGHIDSAKQGIALKGPQVSREMHKMVQTGVDDIGNLRNKMYNYGADMMSNLKDGISNYSYKVRNAISDIAQTVRSYIHFSEPDVGPLANFNDWMPDMMYQMAKGIDDNSYLVEDAINGVAERMNIGTNNSSFNYGGVVINLNVPEGANGQMIVDEIETELANRTMRRRAVFS